MDDCSAEADSVPDDLVLNDYSAARSADDNSVPADWAAADCSAEADSVPDDLVPDDYSVARSADDNSAPVDWAAGDSAEPDSHPDVHSQRAD